MSNDLRGPDATIVSLPAATTFALPLTGAASMSVPSLAAAARTCDDASSETLEQSTINFGESPFASKPSGPVHTAIKSSDADTVVNTMSRPRSSRTESTIGCAVFGERLDLAARAVVDADLVAGREQALRHREAHAAARTDPTERVLTPCADLRLRRPSCSFRGSCGRDPGTPPSTRRRRRGGRTIARARRRAGSRSSRLRSISTTTGFLRTPSVDRIATCGWLMTGAVISVPNVPEFDSV